jgi:hypothetical protein
MNRHCYFAPYPSFRRQPDPKRRNARFGSPDV